MGAVRLYPTDIKGSPLISVIGFDSASFQKGQRCQARRNYAVVTLFRATPFGRL